MRHIQPEKAEKAREAAGGMTSVHEESPKCRKVAQRGGSRFYQRPSKPTDVHMPAGGGRGKMQQYRAQQLDDLSWEERVMQTEGQPFTALYPLAQG